MLIVGELALWIALLLAGWAAIVSAGAAALSRSDLAESGVRALAATAVFLAIATGVLAGAFLDSDVALRLVATSSAANLPAPYRLAALWSTGTGALLIGALCLAATSATAMRQAAGDRRAAIAATTLGVLVSGIVAGAGLPGIAFRALDFPVADGSGLPPDLQHPMLFVHPLLVMLATAASAVAFAWFTAAWSDRPRDATAVRRARAWLSVSWAVQGAAALTGAWWAERGPPPGGFAPGDAAEVIAVLGWLAAAIALHGFAWDERRGGASRWPWLFALLVLPLSLLGMAAARAGTRGSAHPFANAPGAASLVVLAIAGAVVAVVLLRRARAEPGDAPRAAHRDGRRIAGVAHVCGVAVLVAAAAGSELVRDAASRLAIPAGESTTARDAFGRTWTVTNQGISHYDQENRTVTAAAVELTPPRGIPMLIRVEVREYVDSRGAPVGKATAVPEVIPRLFQDVRVLLDGVTADERITMRVRFLPFLGLVWVGGAVALVAGVVFLWPAAREPSP